LNSPPVPGHGKLRGDFIGPLTASLVSIPVEANYGVIALAPLGPAYLAFGAVAAIYCSIIATLTGAISRPASACSAAPARRWCWALQR
jgi:hypothetical protein